MELVKQAFQSGQVLSSSGLQEMTGAPRVLIPMGKWEVEREMMIPVPYLYRNRFQLGENVPLHDIDLKRVMYLLRSAFQVSALVAYSVFAVWMEAERSSMPDREAAQVDDI